MDPLTHSATGLFLGRLGLNRATPGATAILILAANAPDIDVISAAGGALNYLNCHRHLTHALAAMPLVALLPVAAVRLVGRRPLPWLRAYALSLLGVASHLALDATNIYGMRLWLPFSADWCVTGWTSVIDLWIWAVMGLALVAPLLSRLLNAEMGVRGARPPGRAFAVFALLFLAGYDGARAALHARAEAVLDSRLYHGMEPLRVMALPTPANPLLWEGIVETSEFYSRHEINLAGDFDPTRGETYFKPAAHDAQAIASRTPAFRDFFRFVQYPMWRFTPAREGGEGLTVECFDMRFGTPLRPGFVAGALLDGQHRVVRTWFTFGAARPR